MGGHCYFYSRLVRATNPTWFSIPHSLLCSSFVSTDTCVRVSLSAYAQLNSRRSTRIESWVSWIRSLSRHGHANHTFSMRHRKEQVLGRWQSSREISCREVTTNIVRIVQGTIHFFSDVQLATREKARENVSRLARYSFLLIGFSWLARTEIHHHHKSMDSLFWTLAYTYALIRQLSLLFAHDGLTWASRAHLNCLFTSSSKCEGQEEIVGCGQLDIWEKWVCFFFSFDETRSQCDKERRTNS